MTIIVDEKSKFNDGETYRKILPWPEPATDRLDAEVETSVAIKAEIVEDDDRPTSTVEDIEIQDLDS